MWFEVTIEVVSEVPRLILRLTAATLWHLCDCYPLDLNYIIRKHFVVISTLLGKVFFKGSCMGSLDNLGFLASNKEGLYLETLSDRKTLSCWVLHREFPTEGQWKIPKNSTRWFNSLVNRPFGYSKLSFPLQSFPLEIPRKTDWPSLAQECTCATVVGFPYCPLRYFQASLFRGQR